jgi:hypothetical protein
MCAENILTISHVQLSVYLLFELNGTEDGTV